MAKLQTSVYSLQLEEHPDSNVVHETIDPKCQHHLLQLPSTNQNSIGFFSSWKLNSVGVRTINI